MVHRNYLIAAVVAVLSLVTPASSIEAGFTLRRFRSDSSRSRQSEDFNHLIEQARQERDTVELDCIKSKEEGRASRVTAQLRINFAQRSLQALAAAEVQLKAHEGSLHSRSSSLQSRHEELERLCKRLEMGRHAQQLTLKESGNMASEVQNVADKMEGHFSAHVHEIKGSLFDEGAWQTEGSKACGAEFMAVQSELDSVRKDIAEVGKQLKDLEGNRASSEKMRNDQTKSLAGVEKYHVDLEKYCKAKVAGIDQQIQNVHSRRAAEEGVSATDCEVSAWQEGDCSKECGGGTMSLSREVLRRPSGGASCPRLSATTSCNTQACEGKCELGAWSEWTACSKMCNGGHRIRSRKVVAEKAAASFLQTPVVSGKVAMSDNDDAAACGLSQDVQSCNTHVCSDACTFGEWSAWGPCTKACDGGKRGRQRLKSPANAAGATTCNGYDSEFETCQDQQCPAMDSFRCYGRQDVVVMMDSSELLKPDDFRTQKAFAKDLIGRFELDRQNAAIFGLVIFGSLVHGVLPPSDSRGAIEIRLDYANQGHGGQHFHRGFEDAREAFSGFAARKDTPKTVLAILEGKPDSIAKAAEKAKVLKDSGIRVVLAVVGSCVVNKNEFEDIASAPAAENIFYFKSFEELHSRVGEQARNICQDKDGGVLLPSRYLPIPNA